jgi:probable phosphomutase (TIGR03848 family)
MTKFLLIRHATTDAVGKRLSGRLPGVSLNDAGRQQAQHLAGRLADVHISAVYSSPLERAVETAQPFAATHQLSCTTTDDFLEIDFGKWTNSTFQEIENDPQFKLFNTFRSGTRIRGGETMLEAQTRIINGLEKLCAKHHNQTVAVVSHADLIKSAIMYYTGIHLDMFQRIEISPASVSILEIYDETARVTLINDTGSLRL